MIPVYTHKEKPYLQKQQPDDEDGKIPIFLGYS
jgi:hypothetical protein